MIALTDALELVVCDDWAARLVQASAFAHVASSPSCIGYTMASSGRAVCGSCEWQLSARLEDASTPARGRFALFALAAIGEVFVRIAAATAKGGSLW